MRRCPLVLLAGLILALPSVLHAGDFEEGVAAYQAGDFARARQLWERAARQGEAAARFNLGVLYAEGQGVKRDVEKAAELYRQAAEQGYPPAQFNLGVLYEAGDGVPRDVKAAARWWRKAAEVGFVQAQYNLGTLYFYGRGVPQDLETARRWFLAAAQQGDAAAEEALRTVDKRLALERKGSGTQPVETAAGAGSGAGAEGKAKGEGLETAARDQEVAPLGPPLAPEETAAREAWIRAQDPKRYTIQLFANWTEASIVTFIREHDLKPPLAYFRVARQGRPWYSLLQGVYPDAASANAALRAMPARLRVMGAWVRSFGDVQQVIARGSVDGTRLGQAAPAPPASRAGVRSPEAEATAADKPPRDGTGVLHEGDWLRARDPSAYTIQIYADRDRANVLRFARRQRLPGPLAWFQTTHEGRPWYALVHGIYATVADARRDLEGLPAAVRKRGPWVRSLKRIQAIMVEPASGSGPATPAAGAGGRDGDQGGASDQAGSHGGPAGEASQADAGRQVAATGSGARDATETHRPTARQRRALHAGQQAFNGGRYGQALKYWRPLAEEGLAEAQYNLGFLYESGWGVERNEREAAHWYQRASRQRHLRARFNLGLLRLNGRGVPRDVPAAIREIRSAAEGGDPKAQEFLARAYREGLHGLPRDPATAGYWAGKARRAAP